MKDERIHFYDIKKKYFTKLYTFYTNVFTLYFCYVLYFIIKYNEF